ncbi:hypothetical protein SAMN02982929_06517 [Saccharopolyspora kobensis]|uniref:Uncharacterized protein n=1 Tax=Saccharopolyspora kobensis TaxID=146035 RepID=A0A1H6EHA8_9PSEU|nr:hypothetical protein [Saccharopolyspora kobensis]SEG96673.1 hypothetical protein SAMN02982929_06517 [Saccharopolyspora kobensis]SFF04832.1 hypothetical protein SAMN05216506_11831 [Saccharopolyspora kobensis]
MSVESMRNIMNGLADRLHAGLPGSALGDVLDQLIYLTDDNGSDLLEVCREWVRGSDFRRADAALSVSEVFLFNTREELETELGAAAERWPELAPRVTKILENWGRIQPG